MMRHIFHILILMACSSVSLTVSAQISDSVSKRLTSQITYARNESGDDLQYSPIKAPENEFSILTKSTLKPLNFRSTTEKYYLSQISTIDTIIFHLLFPNWKTMSAQQKLIFMEQRKGTNKTMADTLHKVNNTNKQLIYMVNNTNEEIVLQAQDNSFIGVLEAFHKNKWQSVHYWQYSHCGNSYILKRIAPGKSVQYIVPISIGNFPVNLRYKVLGKDKFYYSNIFAGYININDLDDDTFPKVDKLEIFKQWTRGEQ